MPLMLVVIFLSVGVGLFSERLGHRQQASLIAMAIAMTMLYFVFSEKLI